MLDYHLDRRLRLKTADEIEHNGLYQQAVIEIDQQGQQVGRDYIPWHWALTFHGTEISMRDHVGFAQHHEPQQTGGSTIEVRLRPLSTRGGKLWGVEPTYQMFGTDRSLLDFLLRVEPARDGAMPGCIAWASASYSSEIDFRMETESDCLQFTMTLEQAAFDRYAWNLAQGLVDEVALSVRSVDGFY